MNKIAIIGGGASGMMAAITAAKAGASVTIFEKKERIGKKILATGNGKCNFSNMYLTDAEYHSNSCHDLMIYFEQFGVKDCISFFQKLGMLIKDKNGYLYPASEQASTVLDVLRIALDEYGVTVKVNISDISIVGKNNKFILHTKEGSTDFDKVILCCGSMAGEKSSSKESLKSNKSKTSMKLHLTNQYKHAIDLGHHMVPIVPALVQLRCKEEFFKAISGVRTDASISLFIDGKFMVKERGEIQLTDYGISGIPTFQLSRTAAYAIKEKKNVHILIDFFSDYTEEGLHDLIIERLKNAKNKTVEEFFVGLLTKKLCMLSMKLGGLKVNEKIKNIDKTKIMQAIQKMKQLKVTVITTNPFENAQVCAGGISMTEVNDHLESKLVPNLYFAGEILDVDGRCGGYNLQWAWTSGYIAGNEAAK